MGVEELTRLGVRVKPHPASTGVSFAYFHALSTPHLEPSLQTLKPAPPFLVEGKTILRFGLVEGDAVIHASARAVYDPQTARDPAPFAANGSLADEWALVINANELSAIGRADGIEDVVAVIFREQDATVIVVKRGPAGASVYERGGRVSHVPAYRSDRVFKIGTGDVFTAGFALFWAQRRMPAASAADHASRAVADYCENPHSQIGAFPGPTRRAVPSGATGPILLAGAAETIGQRYTLEELRFRLRELNAQVFCPVLDGNDLGHARAAALLIVYDGMRDDDLAQALRPLATGTPGILFAQTNQAPLAGLGRAGHVVDDFSTAVYHSIWAATGAAKANHLA